MSEKKHYQPPKIVSLSEGSAEGELLGTCTSGKYPWSDCQAGEHYLFIDTCNTGAYPSGPGCTTGGDLTGAECQPLGSTAQNQCTAGTRA